MNVINIIDKTKADELFMLGFKGTEQRLNENQMVYSFFATQELLEVISSKFEKNDYYIKKIAFM